MTVKELIEMLKDLPQDHQVIMSKDSEGNGFSPMAESFSRLMYVPDSTWSGEVLSEEDHKEYENEGPFVENCVVLWPTN
jgi:hypothetical protein